MGCKEARKVISRPDLQPWVLSVARCLARELPKSYNFSFLVFPRKEMLDHSLPKETTVRADVGLDPKNKSLYVSLCSRFQFHKSNISNYIPARGVERRTYPKKDFLKNEFVTGKSKVINTNLLNEWCCLLECYVVINESSQSQFEY
jgi:hypothetical protein